MKPIKIASATADSALANRIAADLRKDGPVSMAGPESADYSVLLLVLSSAGLADAGVTDAMMAALDSGKHIIPVLAERVKLPRLINHLSAADFTVGVYPISEVREAVAYLTGPDAPLPMRVLTPRTRRKNRNFGLIFFLAAFIMFSIGLIAVGVFHLQAPAEEFNAIETEVVQTRDAIIGPTLQVYGLLIPRSTEEAQVFEATLERIPTVHRPFMEASATAAAVQARPTAPDTLPLTPTSTP
ncbi:MAG TPA: hypothetical protein VER79_07040 [Candidatus Limnocylindrales bacterium]|nr:hypothetical protein [Candidatus Limnocylindrales bacterium]